MENLWKVMYLPKPHSEVHYLFAIMPNGQKLPKQTEIKIKETVHEFEVEVKFLINLGCDSVEYDGNDFKLNGYVLPKNWFIKKAVYKSPNFSGVDEACIKINAVYTQRLFQKSTEKYATKGQKFIYHSKSIRCRVRYIKYYDHFELQIQKRFFAFWVNVYKMMTVKEGFWGEEYSFWRELDKTAALKASSLYGCISEAWKTGTLVIENRVKDFFEEYFKSKLEAKNKNESI